MVRKLILSLFLISVFSTGAHATTQVVATIDKNPVVVNESFVLEITADDDVDTNALDTSALLKDFIVGRTQVSTQTSMVNFKTTRTTRWLTVLVPRKTGELTIPAFTIDGVSSEPIKLSVQDSDAAGSSNPDIFITTELSRDDVYVQQQVSLKVLLHFSVELRRGSLSEPKLESINIKQQGEDKESTTIINGRRFRVIERSYLVSPQKSGEITIEPPVFSGEVMNENRRSLFSSFGQTKPVSVIADPITLNVRPIPDNYSGLWLPSDLVTLHEEWQNSEGKTSSDNQFVAGEPITRTITLTAANLAQEQLPDIEFDVPARIKLYPDQAELHTRVQNETLISQHKQSFALVAAVPGTYQLPEIKIPWWNTKTKRTQYAVLPAREITVIAGEYNPNAFTLPNQAANQGAQPSANGQSTPMTPAQGMQTQQHLEPQANYLQWLFLAGWIMTALAWFISARRAKLKLGTKATATSGVETQSTGLPLKPVSEKKAYLALMAACKQNKAREAEHLFIAWAQYKLNQPTMTKLDDFAKAFNHEALKQALNDLGRANYGVTVEPWQGIALLSIIKTLRDQSFTDLEDTLSLKLNP